MTPATAEGEPELKPTLGLLSATTLIMGSAIGSGIFLLPSLMGDLVGSPGLVLLTWIVCGLLSLTGALTFAELAGMFPRAGGQYVFLREAFGDKTAFLYGWAFFWAVQTGIIAAVAIAFSLYLGALIPYPAGEFSLLGSTFRFTGTFMERLVAILVIGLLTLVNYVGVKYGGLVQNVFTFLKVAALIGIIGAVFLLGQPAEGFLTPLLPEGAGFATIGAFGLAMTLGMFAYDGWNQTAFIASEVKDPQRIIPRANLLATLGVMAIYVTATAAFLYPLPFSEYTTSSALAADVLEAVTGPTGRALVVAAIVVSTFGTVNAFVLSGPRVYYAMAKNKLFYPGFANVSRRFFTPGFGLLIQAEWAALLVLSGTYADLVTYMVFTAWLFYGVVGVGYFLLRARRPDHPRPYRTPGYPIIPAIFVAASAFIVVNTLLTDTASALKGLAIVATGIPFAFYLTRKRPTPEEAPRTLEPPQEA